MHNYCDECGREWCNCQNNKEAMTEPDGYRKPVKDLNTHCYWWLPGKANPDGEDWERLHTPETILEWLKDNRRRANKDYGQAAEQGTKIEQAFEGGYSSAIQHLIEEFKEEFSGDKAGTTVSEGDNQS